MDTQGQSELPRDILQQEMGDSVESRIAWYRKMRENQPVHYNHDHKLWEVFRYKDVQRVLLDHAEQFDIRRSPNPHMTFGYGIHVCLGSPLARLEAKVALERIVAQFSSLQPDPEKPLLRKNGQVQQLGLLFTPAPTPAMEKRYA